MFLYGRAAHNGARRSKVSHHKDPIRLQDVWAKSSE